MRISRLAAALTLAAALFAAGCERNCRREGCCPTTAAAPPCGCNGTAGPVPLPASPYPATVATPPPGATIIHQ